MKPGRISSSSLTSPPASRRSASRPPLAAIATAVLFDVIGACAPILPADVPCTIDGDCDLSTGGACLAAPTGTRWCSYLDPSCESGRQWSSVDTGDALAGTCVPYVAPDPYAGGIAFVSDRDGNNEIYVMAADGSQQHALTEDPADDLDPLWSPDGQHIAFRSNRSGVPELYLMSPDGGGVANLSHGEATAARWAPDGEHLAFVSLRGGLAEVYVVALDGSEPVLLSANGGTSPDWSPDARRVVYVHDNSLVVASTDRSSRVSMTSGQSQEPAWDPTGAWIAFTHVEVGRSTVFVIPATGGTPVPVTSNGGERMYEPSWSPDGSRLAYLVFDGVEVRVWMREMERVAPVDVVEQTTRPVWTLDGAAIVTTRTTTSDDTDVIRISVGFVGSVNLSHHAGKDSSASLRP